MGSQFRFSHLGICVSDMARSVAFYRDGLGFAVAEAFEVDAGVSRVMELEGVALRSQFMRRADGITLELLHFAQPAPFGEQLRRAMNQLGFTHLGFYVDDLEAACERIRQAGGSVHAHTRDSFNGLQLLFCTDPDGVRIELMQLPPPP